MNCDTAFDLMTDRARRVSSALARHLAECPRCRQMHETLAPALESLAPIMDEESNSLHFAASPDDQSAGPRGNGPLFTAEAVKVAREAAEGLSAWSTDPSIWRRPAVRQVLRYAAVFAAGAFLAASLVRNLETRQNPAAGQCTRGDFAAQKSGLTAAEARAVILTCASCHGAPQSEKGGAAAIPFNNRNAGIDRPVLIDDASVREPIAVCSNNDQADRVSTAFRVA